MGSERGKRNDDADVLPSDVIIQKARDVRNAKRSANENSQVAVTLDESKLLNEAERKADILSALGRVSVFHEKTCQYLDYLANIIAEPPELEDMDDLRKRQKRSTEFANRFARNHLYQIGRAVSYEETLLERNFLLSQPNLFHFFSPSTSSRPRKFV